MELNSNNIVKVYLCKIDYKKKNISAFSFFFISYFIILSIRSVFFLLERKLMLLFFLKEKQISRCKVTRKV